ncbi:B98a [Murid betaherpesvirus 8]|uniref:B98a n=1 Tax=Rat cytomegalovirus (isolate England) TaxID=1261657 RepID=A0A0E3SY91_RCMVE|nr:B98a [Murid betaherpesvirus 8]WPH25007.1 B98a [Murid betaherpesvirus 8]WPH25141.1 B98a [Murid betaherpesvirus 8]
MNEGGEKVSSSRDNAVDGVSFTIPNLGGAEQIDDVLAGVLRSFSDHPFDLFCVYNMLERKGDERNVPVSAMRIAYLRYIFNKINRSDVGSGLAFNFLSAVDAELSGIGAPSLDPVAPGEEECAQFNVAYALFTMSPRRYMRILRSIEKDSRGQSSNPVWHAMRIDIISATRFFDVFSTASLTTAGRSSNAGYLNCEAVRFGARCEPVVRMLLEEFVTGPLDDAVRDMGLLLDPSSGILGASLDFCTGLTRDDDDLLVVRSGAAIFEIKCRFKYLRDRSDETVAAFLAKPNAETFAAFILSHPIPAVEYKEIDEMPSGREALMSHDKMFKINHKRRRSCKPPDFIRGWLKELIGSNSKVASTVFTFDTCVSEEVTVPGDGERSEATTRYLDVISKATFSFPVFINPRHPYYCQILLQQYVLSQYYINAHDDPERISPDDLPIAYLVSAILRKRDEPESELTLRINGRVSECDEVPLCVIVTPVRLDPLFTKDAVNCVLNTWKRDTDRKTGLQLWVRTAVNEYVASSTQAPPTP